MIVRTRIAPFSSGWIEVAPRASDKVNGSVENGVVTSRASVPSGMEWTNRDAL